jgi:hypothetical protein
MPGLHLLDKACKGRRLNEVAAGQFDNIVKVFGTPGGQFCVGKIEGIEAVSDSPVCVFIGKSH